jgi:hypothetical protein
MKIYPSKWVGLSKERPPLSEQAYEQHLALNKASKREDTTKPKPNP